jgi:hypothetical protein
MATDTQKYSRQVEQEPRHSAIAEFSRDERRPAVLLLSALLLSALFFGIGLMVGRWTAQPATVPAVSPAPSHAASPTPSPQPATSQSANGAGATQPNAAHRFALVVATYDTAEKAQALVNALQQAGYTDARSNAPRSGEARPRYSVLVGRYATQDEARQSADRMRSANDPRLKNAKVIQDSGQ